MRLETNRGAFVTVARKGAQQAGAMFVVELHHDGSFDVFGPAPQSFLDEELSERRFERVLEKVSGETKDNYLERQINFDPDLWIVETESGSGDISLTLVS